MKPETREIAFMLSTITSAANPNRDDDCSHLKYIMERMLNRIDAKPKPMFEFSLPKKDLQENFTHPF